MTGRLAIAAIVVALAAPGSAAAKGPSVPGQDVQALDATVALMNSAQAIDGAASFRQHWCRRVKRERWSCSIEVSKPYDGFACTATAIVSTRWWRFPPATFGCPYYWNPGASWLI